MEKENSQTQISSLEEIEEEYREGSEILMRQIAMREKLLQHLKIAKPENLARIRAVISQMNRAIEASEKCLESLTKLRDERVKLDKELNALTVMTEQIKPEFLKYIAEHHPENLEEMEDLFVDADDDNNASH